MAMQRPSANRSEMAIKQVIEDKQRHAEKILAEIEDNFVNATKGHITYHDVLIKEAKERKDITMLTHHVIMKETYESILSNYESTRHYNMV